MRLIQSKSIRAIGVILSAGFIVVCLSASLVDHANDTMLRLETRIASKDWIDHLNQHILESQSSLREEIKVGTIKSLSEELGHFRQLVSIRFHSSDRRLNFNWHNDFHSAHAQDSRTNEIDLVQALGGETVVTVNYTKANNQEKVFGDTYIPVQEGQEIVGAWHIQIDQTAIAMAHKQVFSYLAGGLILLTLFISIALGIVFVNRIREQEKIEKHARFLAHHDETSGLYKRNYFDEALESLTWKAKNGQIPGLALYWIDIDDFSSINNAMGRAAGDALIRQIASDIKNVASKKDFAARVGGDQFAILRADISNAEEAEHFARQLVSSLNRAHEYKGAIIPAKTSVGVKFSNEGKISPDEFVRSASLAMYGARSGAGEQYCLHTPDMEAELLDKQQIETDLKAAMQDGSQFQVHYQPQFQLETGQLDGYEALIRWEHPTRGYVQPSDFIPIAESVGLICDLGRWVLINACKDAAQWSTPIRVAVNVSPLQFQNDDITACVAEALKISTLSPERLELEITESLLFDKPEEALTKLAEIKALGVSIAMDDFGTGYSCLKHLWQFPFDKIKIDQSFVKNILVSEKVQSIVSSTIQMGHMLGIKITAEGVEEPEQAEFLKEMNCDIVQGFLFGKSHPFGQIDEKGFHNISIERLRQIVRRSDGEREVEEIAVQDAGRKLN